MSNVVITPPPLYSPMVNSSGKLTSEWSKWFSTFYTTYTQFFPSQGLGNNSNYTAIFSLPILSTIDRDSLTNVSDGNMIYNSDTNQVNLYSSGSWNII
jgi:hypothetical protein